MSVSFVLALVCFNDMKATITECVYASGFMRGSVYASGLYNLMLFSSFHAQPRLVQA